jgi:hypothetical protein
MKQFEVTFEGELPGTPQQVWDAFTRHTSGWLWNIAYEPRVGGAETGLTSAGGAVTAWDPPRHFATRAERPDGWCNELDYRLDGTHLRYRHRSNAGEDEYDLQLDACRRHTAFYYHSLGEYLRHFADRDAAYFAVDGPEASAARGSFDRLRAALGAGDAGVGDRVRLAGAHPIDGVVDYRTDEFLGVRAENALYRFYGRDAFGWPVGVAHHVFQGDPQEQAWRVWLDEVFDGRRAA